MNAGTLRGIPGKRIGRVSEAAKTLRGDGAFGVPGAWGTSAPSGGEDGDTYCRTGSVSPGVYVKSAGVWVLKARVPALFTDDPKYAVAPWVPNTVGSTINETSATAAELFPASQTGVSKSGTTITNTAASASGTLLGTQGATLAGRLTTLPGVGQTWGLYLGTAFVQLLVNNAGVATLDLFGSALFTFSATVTTTTNNRFVLRLTPYALMFAQMTSNNLIQSGFYVFSAYAGGNFATLIGYGTTGHGTWEVQGLEAYA